MEKILITGGSGFIGTNLIADLAAKKYTIRNLDIAKPASVDQMRYWERTDLRDRNRLAESVTRFQPDYIVDLAARTDLDGKSLAEYDSNTIATKNLLWCAQKVTTLKKMILTSSMLVCKTGYIPENQWDYCPTTWYGKSKAAAERYIWKHRPSADWAIIRPTSIWGPWFGVPYRNFFDMVCKGHYFHIGSKSCKKTYGYVKNAVYQIIQILFTDTKNSSQKVFYIGDYEPYSIEQWADGIAAVCGRKIIKMPYFLIWCAAVAGDVLKLAGMDFPMTSFRLKNMTTDNIQDLSATARIAPALPYTRQQGTEETLRWMRQHR